MTCKAFTYSPVPAADCSPISSSDTRQSEQLNLIPTAVEFCESVPPMDGSPNCACTKETFGCSIHPNTPDEWIACMQASLASLTAPLASERAKLMSVICGPIPQGSLASYDRDSRSWKTCQESFLTDTPPLSSERFPRWGMTRAGQLFPLPMLALHTCASGGGALQNVPTPTANDAEKRGDFDPVRSWGTAGYAKMWQTPVADDAVDRKRGKFNSRGEPKLSAQVKLWPTPTASLGTNGGRVTPRKSREGGTLIEAVSARAFPTPTAMDYRTGDKPEHRRARMRATHEWHSPNLNDVAAPGGKLNPVWVEWLMGWPLGWTGLKASATGRFRSKPRSRGASLEGRE